MKRVAIFSNTTPYLRELNLENQINNFILTHKVNILDVKYAITDGDLSALIIYEDKIDEGA